MAEIQKGSSFGGYSSAEDYVGARLEALFGGSGSRRGNENLAPATARGGPDNSAVTIRGIRGIFYDALELAQATTWSRQIGLYIPSNTKTETHTWLGQVPEPRKHFGGLNKTPVNDFTFQVTNEDYEITLPFSMHDQLWDQINHISRRTGEMSTAWADHWNKLAVDVLEDNDTAYDGTAMFSATHSIGDSGTLSNLLTNSDLGSLDVSDVNRPTKAEGSAILSDLAAYMYRMKDDKGRPSNQGARKFMLLCHPAALPGFRTAISDELYITGGSNELRNLQQEFVAVAEPRLASDDEVYLFRLDGPSSKPLILQEAKAPTLQIVGPQSEHAIKTNEILYVSKSIRACAPGEFRHAIKATMS